MNKLLQQEIFKDDSLPSQDDWTFNGHSTRKLTHCYHDYPARMIPQIARKLLENFAKNARLLFDPYCGTGTSLVEANIKGINAIGSDLNPLARMIAKAKTTPPSLKELDYQIKNIQSLLLKRNFSLKKAPPSPLFPNLHFWFKPQVIEKLSFLKSYIDCIADNKVKLFFLVAFSETVRESSNTRKNEFKLYRYQKDKLYHHNPNVFEIFLSKLQRNREGLKDFISEIKGYHHAITSKICDFNTVLGISSDILKPNSVDIVITSPPYGDSRTTVAYGQYSRLSSEWLGFPKASLVDNHLMGGNKASLLNTELPCASLMNVIYQIKKQDARRAKEVFSFYADLWNSIQNVSAVIKKGGYACYVVGNRKVKGYILPTDQAIQSFFEICGLRHIHTFIRSIPNKRMPLKNSPTNITGKLDATMTKEFVVVMNKI